MARDMLNNQVAAVPSSAATRAERFAPDATRPTLQQFYMDLNILAVALCLLRSHEHDGGDIRGLAS